MGDFLDELVYVNSIIILLFYIDRELLEAFQISQKALKVARKAVKLCLAKEPLCQPELFSYQKHLLNHNRFLLATKQLQVSEELLAKMEFTEIEKSGTVYLRFMGYL